jgi:Putative prokaryotic signal transducing protein
MSLLSRVAGWFGGADDAPVRLPRPDEPVVLARPNGEAEAQLFHDMLDEQGIRSMVRNTDASSARAGGMGPVWAYELIVLRKNVQRARQILGLDE